MADIYQATSTFPDEERFGLTSQMRRAAVSVPSNIAEGHGRKATAAYLNHLSIAFGSLMELETQIQISDRLCFIASDISSGLLLKTEEIGRMLSGLKKSLSEKLD